MGKSAGYHGIQNMKVAKKENGTYGEIAPFNFAKNISLNSLLNAIEQHADNRLIFRVPKDDGYDGELGTTAQDTELEKSLGYYKEGKSGGIKTSLVSYARNAIYYEFTEHNEDGVAYAVKVWLYNVEIGKASENTATDTDSIEFGNYSYPIRVYGDKLMASDGKNEYLDENGLGRNAFMYISRPGDTGYETFGDAVPVPEIKGTTTTVAETQTEGEATKEN